MGLAPTSHASGETIATCEGCEGSFVDYDALIAIERWARRAVGRVDASEIARRAFRPQREPIECPSCGGAMVAREWRFATLVFVDVCVECRGVWLDTEELQQVERS